MENSRRLMSHIESLMDSLTERGRQIDGITENVEAIRSSLLNEMAANIDESENAVYKKVAEKISGRKRLIIFIESIVPDPITTQYETYFGDYFNLKMKIEDIKTKNIKSLDLEFGFNSPDNIIPITGNHPFVPKLQCRFRSDDLDQGVSFEDGPKDVSQLQSNDLSMVFEITDTARRIFAPDKPPIQ